MPLPNLFSRRKRLQSGGQDVYVYDNMPQRARVQFVQTIYEAVGPYREGGYLDAGSPGIKVYNTITSAMRKEQAVFALPPSGDPYTNADKEFFDWFLNEKNIDSVIDGIEVTCRALEILVASNRYEFQNYAKIPVKDAIDEINARFLEEGFGYQYHSEQVIRVDTMALHQGVVVPALTLLSDRKYATAEREFLAAHGAYRARDYETCLIECAKAFESVLKIIGTERGWRITPNDPSKKLLDAAYASGFIEPALQAEFTALRSLLESAVPVVRNRMGGHGAGTVPRNVPGHFASLQLHQTAAMILFLAEHHKANP